MTIPGAGGQVPPRPDQGYTGSQSAAIAPGTSNIVRARLVIVSGPNAGVYAYSTSPPAFGSLISSDGIAVAGTDPYGNATLQGNSSYQSGATYSAVNMNGGQLRYYTAPGAGGPWTLIGSLVIPLTGASTLVLNFTSLSGAINTPQPAIGGLPLSLPPPATYSQVGIAPVYNAVNNIYALLQAAGVSL